MLRLWAAISTKRSARERRELIVGWVRRFPTLLGLRPLARMTFRAYFTWVCLLILLATLPSVLIFIEKPAHDSPRLSQLVEWRTIALALAAAFFALLTQARVRFVNRAEELAVVADRLNAAAEEVRRMATRAIRLSMSTPANPVVPALTTLQEQIREMMREFRTKRMGLRAHRRRMLLAERALKTVSQGVSRVAGDPVPEKRRIPVDDPLIHELAVVAGRVQREVASLTRTLLS